HERGNPGRRIHFLFIPCDIHLTPKKCLDLVWCEVAARIVFMLGTVFLGFEHFPNPILALIRSRHDDIGLANGTRCMRGYSAGGLRLSRMLPLLQKRLPMRPWTGSLAARGQGGLCRILHPGGGTSGTKGPRRSA